MFDVPLDAWYVWLGATLASVAVLGTVGTLPTSAPPDAAAAGETVDAVAAEEHPTTAEHPLDADAVKVGPRGLALRGPGGTAHASFTYGPVTPAADGSKLQRVLHGTPPERVFASRRAFSQAVVDARTRKPTWHPADRTLLVRRMAWGDRDVVLVDA